MTITMFDSVNPDNIPAGAELVAAYIDGYGGYNTAVARFGVAKVISISIGDNDADVADVENGAMTPADLPGWIERQVARGVKRPVVYCNRSTWSSVQNAVGGRDVSYWIADPGGPTEIPGADAVQNVWTNVWDSSVVQPSFPFGGGTPNPHPVLQVGVVDPVDGVEAVHDAQTRLNLWRVDVGKYAELAVDGNFGPVTETAVKDFQVYAKLTEDGVVGTSTWTALDKTPLPPPPPDTYGPPQSIGVAVPPVITAELSWAAPKPTTGLPDPSEYRVFLYLRQADEAHLVKGYPVKTPETKVTLSLAHGQVYIAHVVASGLNGAHARPWTYASVTFTAS